MSHVAPSLNERMPVSRWSHWKFYCWLDRAALKDRGRKNCNTVASKLKGSLQGKKGWVPIATYECKESVKTIKISSF